MNHESRHDERRGFTLIEMMVIVALIGILTAIGFVSMLHYRSIIRVNASARDVAGQFRLARAKAIRDGRSVMVSFPSAVNQYTLGIDADESGTFDTSFPKDRYLQTGIVFGYCDDPLIDQVPGHTNPVSCPVEINGGCPTGLARHFHFRHDGTASFTGVVYLIPSVDLSATGNRPDRMRAVDWESATGRVRVWKRKEKAPEGRKGRWR